MTAAATPDRINVLVLMADQMKATASHLYGNSFCQTPALARLAGRGVLYDTAIAPQPLCVPSRVSFWTAQYPHAHGAQCNETLMPLEAEHAFTLWHAAGYRLGLIGKNHCFEQPRDLELFSTWHEITHEGVPAGRSSRAQTPWLRPAEAIEAAHRVRREMPRQGPVISYATTDFPLEHYSTSLVADQTVRFLEQHRDEPFVAWASFPDPHSPYEAPAGYAQRFGPDVVELPPIAPGEWERAPERNRVLHELLSMTEAPHDDVYGVVGAYYAMVAFLDDAVGRILDALDRLELRDRTLVVFTADHGDFAGEHGMMGKGGVFYDCLVRVPLIVSLPARIPQGAREDGIVSLIDVVPTILELQGIEVPAAMQGRPLPVATSRPSPTLGFSEYGAGGPPFTLDDLRAFPKPYGPSTRIATLQWREAEGRRRMVRGRRWKYVHDPLGDRDELYDLVHDPWEHRNLAGQRRHAGVLSDLRLALLDWSGLTEDHREAPL